METQLFKQTKFTEGRHTACLQTYCGEVTGFHITASPHGSTRPLARCDDSLDKGKRDFAPGELEANAHLFAAARTMYKTIGTVLASHSDDLLPGVRRLCELAMEQARGETLPEAA